MSSLIVSASTQDYHDRNRAHALDRMGNMKLNRAADLVLEPAPESATERATGFIIKVGKPDCNSKITFTPNDIPDDQSVVTIAGFVYSQKGFYWRKNTGDDTPELLTELAQAALSGDSPTTPATSTERPIELTEDQQDALATLICALADDLRAIQAQETRPPHVPSPAELTKRVPLESGEAYYYVQHCNPMGCGRYESKFNSLSEAITFADQHAQSAYDNGDTDFHYIVNYHTPNRDIEKYTVRATDKAPNQNGGEMAESAGLPPKNQALSALFQAPQKPRKVQTKLPTPSARPVFGEVSRARPKAAEPPSKLTLSMQEGRTEDVIEEERMKAAEALTIPMFGDVKAESPKAPNVRVNEQSAPVSLDEFFGPKVPTQDRRDARGKRTVAELFEGRTRNSYPLGTIQVTAPRIGKPGKSYAITLYRTRARCYVKFYSKRALSIDVKQSMTVSQIALQIYNRLPDGVTILGFDRDGNPTPEVTKPCPDCGGAGSKRRNNLCEDCYRDYVPPAGDNMTAAAIREQVRLCREL